MLGSHCSFQYTDEKITEAEQEARGPVLPIMAFIYLPPKSGIDLTSVDSGSFCWRDRTASTLDTIASVGICLGVTECLSPEESICVSISSKGPEEIFLTQLASGLRRLAFFVSLFRFRAVLLLSARLSAIVCIVLSKVVGKSCLSLSSRSYILL